MERSKPKVDPEPEKVKEEVKEVVQEKPKVDPPDPPERQMLKFKKIGGGSFVLKGKMIKPGQIFEAFPEDIPPAFKNTIMPLSGTIDWELAKKEESSQVKVKPQDVVKPLYKVVPHGKSPLWWDIVTETGKDENGEPIYKVLNEKGLKKEVAEDLMKKMQG